MICCSPGHGSVRERRPRPARPLGLAAGRTSSTSPPYDEAVSKLGFQEGRPGPAGCLFHWVHEAEGGVLLTIVDVWESQEHADAFYRDSLTPTLAEFGVTAPPRITTDRVDDWWSAGPDGTAAAAGAERTIAAAGA